MTLTSKQKYIVAGLAVIISFATGRFSVQQAEVRTTTSAQTTVKQDQDKNTHTETTVTTIKTPDGTVKTVKTIDQVADVKTDINTSELTKNKTDTIPPKINTLNISALIGNDFSKGIGFPAYGVSVTKQILGPVTVGAYGLTTGVVGISIGLNF